MLELSSLVLFTSDQAAVSAFYRAVGVPLESEDHDGELHQAAEVGRCTWRSTGQMAASGTGPARWGPAGATSPASTSTPSMS